MKKLFVLLFLLILPACDGMKYDSRMNTTNIKPGMTKVQVIASLGNDYSTSLPSSYKQYNDEYYTSGQAGIQPVPKKVLYLVYYLGYSSQCEGMCMSRGTWLEPTRAHYSVVILNENDIVIDRKGD